MNIFPLLLAYRTLTTKQTSPLIRMLSICFISIFIASFALSLIISIMNGFEYETNKKLQGIHDDITIHAHGQELKYETVKKILTKEFHESIAIINPKIYRYGMLMDEASQTPYVVTITAIATEANVIEKLAPLLKSSKEKLEELKKPDTFLVGLSLSEQLVISDDQKLNILLPDLASISHNKLSFQNKHGTMLSSFQTGMEEFDMNIIFCSLDTMNNLVDSAITHIGLTLKPSSQSDIVLKKLRKRFGTSLSIYSWKELYPALLEATALEKYAMFLILGLVLLIASISILALLFMLINQKRIEITLLLVHGITINQIQSAYLTLGCGIAIIASILGTMFSSCIAYLINTFQLIKLPEIYGLSHLPALMNMHIVFGVNILVALLSIFCCLIATRQIISLSSAEVLRFEG